MSNHTSVSLPADIVIGKDVLELVSSAMYVDPLTIYREYVQNAADSIDMARSNGLLSADEVGRVDIFLDLNLGTRSVKIRDNGLGVTNGDFAKRLTAIGGSHKRGTSARGFRGVGRLAGLGYCQELIFRSRSSGEEPVQELRWDCRLLKKLLSDTSYRGDLHDLIQEVAKVTTLVEGHWPEHFYEVEMVKPVRGSKDQLLNRDAIAAYLSQVAPVPFSPEFSFGPNIHDHLVQHIGSFGEIHIYIDGAKEPLYRPYQNDYTYGEGKRDTFSAPPQMGYIMDRDGGVGAVYWILHHGYHGAIPSGQGIAGLRARKGNIQIGDQRIFAEAFPETRFASWTVGEVHIIDNHIQPNGRRDEFEQNVHYDHFITRLSEIGTDIGRLCRSNSAVRNRIKNFELTAIKISGKIDILEQGAIDGSDADVIIQEIRADLYEIKKLTATIISQVDRSDLEKRYVLLEERLTNAIIASSSAGALRTIPEKDRVTVQRMIKLIYDCSPNRLAAKTLVDRILARLGEGHTLR